MNWLRKCGVCGLAQVSFVGMTEEQAREKAEAAGWGKQVQAAGCLLSTLFAMTALCCPLQHAVKNMQRQ